MFCTGSKFIGVLQFIHSEKTFTDRSHVIIFNTKTLIFFQPEDWPYVNLKQFPFVHALVIPESEVVAILPEKTGSGYKAQKLALLSQVGGKNFGGNGQILATFTVEKSMIVITFLMRKPCR